MRVEPLEQLPLGEHLLERQLARAVHQHAPGRGFGRRCGRIRPGNRRLRGERNGLHRANACQQQAEAYSESDPEPAHA